MSAKNEKATSVQRRLAAIEALCCYARTHVEMEAGSNVGLARASDDISHAILALALLRKEIAADSPDQEAEAISALGRVAAQDERNGAVRRPWIW